MDNNKCSHGISTLDSSVQCKDCLIIALQADNAKLKEVNAKTKCFMCLLRREEIERLEADLEKSKRAERVVSGELHRQLGYWKTLEADNKELVECLEIISTKAIEPVCMILATNALNKLKHKPSKE